MTLHEKILKALPPLFGRAAVGNLLPGIINPKTLANLSSLGLGPPKIKTRAKIIYERDSFVPWLCNHLMGRGNKDVDSGCSRGK